MKVLKKEQVFARNDPKDLQHTIAERNVLALVNTSEHPFLLGLRFAFHTPAKLYYVLNFCNGGDLYFLLSRCKRFKEGQARFYAGEVFCALQHLHSLGVIYRDLKPGRRHAPPCTLGGMYPGPMYRGPAPWPATSSPVGATHLPVPSPSTCAVAPAFAVHEPCAFNGGRPTRPGRRSTQPTRASPPHRPLVTRLFTSPTHARVLSLSLNLRERTTGCRRPREAHRLRSLQREQHRRHVLRHSRLSRARDLAAQDVRLRGRLVVIGLRPL